LFSLSFLSEDFARWANRKRKFRWLSLAPPITAPDIDPATTMDRDTMLRDITGDLTAIVTTGDLTGGTGIGGATAGIGIELLNTRECWDKGGKEQGNKD
jgi:hypothetical protein